MDCLSCNKCGSADVARHGSMHHQTAYKCKNCGHKFTRLSRYNKLSGISHLWTKKEILE